MPICLRGVSCPPNSRIYYGFPVAKTADNVCVQQFTDVADSSSDHLLNKRFRRVRVFNEKSPIGSLLVEFSEVNFLVLR